MMTRREAIRAALLGGAALSVLPHLSLAQSPAAPAPTGPFTLPPLPYGYDALEPHIDALTMQIHHDRHHKAYVENLNKAVASHPEILPKQEMRRGEVPAQYLLEHLDKIPADIRTAVRNNGGGHMNHSLFWQMMKKGGGGEPTGELAAAMNGKFGSFDKFKDEWTRAALGRFGSGWAWLVVNPGGALSIESLGNQDDPVLLGQYPILGIDVWEHAYYLKYQNKRADYVAAWFNVINWDFVADRYAHRKLYV